MKTRRSAFSHCFCFPCLQNPSSSRKWSRSTCSKLSEIAGACQTDNPDIASPLEGLLDNNGTPFLCDKNGTPLDNAILKELESLFQNALNTLATEEQEEFLFLRLCLRYGTKLKNKKVAIKFKERDDTTSKKLKKAENRFRELFLEELERKKLSFQAISDMLPLLKDIVGRIFVDLSQAEQDECDHEYE